MTIDSIMLIKSAIHKHIMQKKNCIVILLLMALFVYLEYPIKELCMDQFLLGLLLHFQPIQSIRCLYSSV